MLQVSWRWSPKHVSRKTTKVRDRNLDWSERRKIFLLLSLLSDLTLSCIWTIYFYFMPLSKKLQPAFLPEETTECVWLADSTSSWLSKDIASVVIFTFHVTNFALYFQSLPSNPSTFPPPSLILLYTKFQTPFLMPTSIEIFPILRIFIL